MASRPDLRALFRTNSRALTAADIFADREEEWSAAGLSLADLVATRRDPAFDIEDVQTPRQNVLVFYGVGGIGKSTLSRQIAEHLADPGNGPSHWTPSAPELGRILPIRIDLSRQSGANFETVMLAVRLAVADLGQPMPAFDLAFHRYWALNHPGEPIEEYLRRHTLVARLSSAGVLREQMDSVLADLSQVVTGVGTLGTLVGQSLRLVVRVLRERHHRLRALAGCRRLPDLLEADPDQDTLSYYSHLLAWDLSRLPEGKTATPVVLLDTFEDVGDRAHRDFERLIQRMVWLMPNALFIITGRNRLQWDDQRLAGQLDWVGGHHWPGLAPEATGNPRQHRVGYLSEHDSEDYLHRRLTVGNQPLMDRPTRQALVKHSRGLPLYLDLAVLRFLDLYERTGHAPNVSEFRHDFPALVARTFRDLTPDERQILRAVSLLDSFSIELATATAGMDRDAAALRLVDRPFVEVIPGAVWPYQVHDLVRAAVRDADSTGEDRWSDADWRRAAQRAFDALGSELVKHSDDTDRRVLLGCLRQGLRLARDFGLPLGWLADAAFAYVADYVWEPVELEGALTVDSPSAALAETLTAIAQRQRQDRSLIVDRLRMVLASEQLPSDLLELPLYFLAECERDLGRVDASMEGMRQVAAAGGRLAADARRGILHLARRVGRFPLVLETAHELGSEGKSHRTLGDLWWTQGDITLSCSSYAKGRDEALALGRRGEAALSQACLAFAASFQDRARANEQILRGEQLLAGMRARFAELQIRNARLLMECGSAPDLPERAEEIAALAAEEGLSSCVAYARFVACFHAAIVGSPALVQDGRARLSECVSGAEFAYLLELAHYLTGKEAPAELPRAVWIDGVEATRNRWMTLVTERRRSLSA